MEGANRKMIDKKEFLNLLENYCRGNFGKELDASTMKEVLTAISTVVMKEIFEDWNNTNIQYRKHKRAYYFSAEYLMGRALGNNLINLGIYGQINEILQSIGLDLSQIEEAEEDAGLGNGGLGRLAACFLDSAANMNIPLYGYGIRYENGLFCQKIINGEQVEFVDRWLKNGGNVFSVRREELSVTVDFDDFSVIAVPYDVPIISYDSKNINTLRLWKSECIEDFDFKLFNEQKYLDAMKTTVKAENVSRVLYPNDSKYEGKILRLRQQYFMVSASLKDIFRSYVKDCGENFDEFENFHAIQLNDTHPVLAIPEFIRILMDDYFFSFNDALKKCEKIFAYTNHTILKEALEVWNFEFIEKVSKRIGEIIKMLDEHYNQIIQGKVEEDKRESFRIIQNNFVHMANIAIHVGMAINGVAELHTNILKNIELKEWNELYPTKFQNKTNGVTPRRWLRLCNHELSRFITDLLGNEEWIKDLSLLKGLEKFVDDEEVLERFIKIKKIKKTQLSDYLDKTQGIRLDVDSIFDIQVKRLHEYKRQFLNALYILDLYYTLKENKGLDIPKVTFIFGAKAFPGYARAKAIIKFICAIGKKIDNDDEVRDKIKVVFVENYGVSVAEKLFPAADISKQISTAGKEASGTGNMKFMLNGALTFGTYDGANVEIVSEGGEENNFIFGLRVEEINEMKETYNSKEYYENNEDIKRVVDSLVDGTFDDGGTGEFLDLYKSLLEETYCHADEYFLLADFKAFKEEEQKVFETYKDKYKWAKMCLINIANCGNFSSDRTILEYAKDIWDVQKVIVK